MGKNEAGFSTLIGLFIVVALIAVGIFLISINPFSKNTTSTSSPSEGSTVVSSENFEVSPPKISIPPREDPAYSLVIEKYGLSDEQLEILSRVESNDKGL